VSRVIGGPRIWEEIKPAAITEPSFPRKCCFRRRAATASGKKSATDSNLNPATRSDPSRPPIPNSERNVRSFPLAGEGGRWH
jgi:hypothetical protein